MAITGTVHPAFEPARTALAKQLARYGGGASLTVIHRGEVVVDVVAGTRDAAGTPWTPETLSLSFSTTKGVASTLVHVLATQGRVDYDAPVARYWPAFAHGGKGDITVRTLMSHRAGLWDVRTLVDDASQMLDWGGMLERIERASPAPPSSHARSGYHGLTYGWLVGGLVEHVTGKPFGQVLADELARPLGLEGCFIGAPEGELARRATLLGVRSAGARTPSSAANGDGRGAGRDPARPRRREGLQAGLLRLAWRAANTLAGHDPRNVTQALMPRGIRAFDWNADATARACIPAANGLFTSRALARMYAMLAEGGALGGVRLLSSDVLRQAMRRHGRGGDDVLLLPMGWRLGYHGVDRRAPHAFGHFGFGGSGAWCDPSRRLAVAMTLNSGVGTPLGDMRIVRLNRVIARAVAGLA
jgi:CubicO group peptidase (beta-lactamase class C family)